MRIGKTEEAVKLAGEMAFGRIPLGLFWAFVKRDLQERFAGSLLGPFTVLLQPLAQILVFVFLFKYVFRVKIKLAGNQEDFLRFFLSGFVPWSIHAEALTRGAMSVLSQGHLLTKAAFPAEVLPLSSVCSVYLLGVPALLILWGVLLVTGGLPWLALLGLQLLLVQAIFSLGVVLFLAALLVYLRDLQQFMGLFIMVWFYASPILYSFEMLPPHLRFILKLNPYTYFVELWHFLCLGTALSKEAMVIVLVSTAGSLFFGWAFFKRLKEGFADVF